MLPEPAPPADLPAWLAVLAPSAPGLVGGCLAVEGGAPLAARP
jgi:hypothetical protein